MVITYWVDIDFAWVILLRQGPVKSPSMSFPHGTPS